jgi:hypothetical protein
MNRGKASLGPASCYAHRELLHTGTTGSSLTASITGTTLQLQLVIRLQLPVRAGSAGTAKVQSGRMQ